MVRRTKLVAIMFLLLVAVLGMVSFTLYQEEKDILSSISRKSAVETVQSWGRLCTETYRSGDSVSAEKHFSEFFKNPALEEAVCISPQGTIYAATKPTLIGDPEPAFDIHSLPVTLDIFSGHLNLSNIPDHTITARYRIPLDKYTSIGVRLNFSLPLMEIDQQEKLRSFARRIYIVCAIALILGGTSILLIANMFMKSLQVLTEGARIIGTGKLDHSIAIAANDEVGDLAKEFNQMTKKLKELDEMKQDFMSGITHGLRSPVTAIKLCSSNVLEELKNKAYNRIPEQLFIINTQTERLNRFIDSLLEVSKIESGRVVLSKTLLNLEDLLDRTVSSFKPYAKQKQIDLNLVVENELPNIEVDPDKIDQALSNLIGNALKFTAKGMVTVYLAHKNGWQEIRVEDTGPGLQNVDIAHLFEKFHASKSAIGAGTGLGLFIANSIIKMHGGRIECASVPGKGSTFTILLPDRKTS